MTERYVVFSHGKDSEPWGSKIAAMAEIAREEGFVVESVDYRGIDDPKERVTRLLAFCKDLRGSLVLVGSSMGGYVSVAGSSLLQARGMFLLAPALYMPGYEKFSPRPAACPTTIIHGWRDDVIPVDNSVRFAREQKATLHMVDSDHGLLDQIRMINHCSRTSCSRSTNFSDAGQRFSRIAVAAMRSMRPGAISFIQRASCRGPR